MESPGPLGEIQNVRRTVTKSEDLSEEHQIKYNKLMKKAKELAGEGLLRQCYGLYVKAYRLYPSDKLKTRIVKIKAHLEESDEDSDEGESMVNMGNGFQLCKTLHEKLYAHQRAGVLWLWEMYKCKKGGILGDDMGLGKTIQVIAYLAGMFDAGKIHSVLIVLPVAVMVNWEKEFDKWAPGVRVLNFHGGTKRERERAVQKVSRRGGVCLTSYGMLVNNAAVLAEVDGREMVWDYVILDEGHKIKNPSNKCSKGLHAIPARNRIIMTGTPVQNNLKEMWALFDWTHQGALLGTQKTFASEFEQPIFRARQKDSTTGEKRLGQEMSERLRSIIRKYFLRRTKADVKKDKEDGARDAGDGNHAPAMPTLTRKNDLIIWVYLSEIQLKIYHDFLNSDEVKQLLNSTRSPLMGLTVLKKVCDHPRLMSNEQCHALGLTLDDGLTNDENMYKASAEQSAASRIQHVDDQTLIRESGKMVFLVKLLDQLKQEGHRSLVFSQSLKVLNIIQKVMKNRGHKVARLDGSVKHVYEREDIIKRFQENKSYSIFLLTTQVGGVGLTLTAADRVVIYDPSWNPATDAQAVDRAFRIGQTKDVVIYRLITCGSIEEKIYRRQIFKDSITKQTTGDTDNPYRYFTGTQLKELFVLDNPDRSETQIQLQELLANRRKTDTSLDEHIAFLHTLDMFGISDHDLMFNKEIRDEASEEVDDAPGGEERIQAMVNQAQQRVNLECEDNLKLAEKFGKYPGPQQASSRPKKPLSDNPISHPPSYPVTHYDAGESTSPPSRLPKRDYAPDAACVDLTEEDEEDETSDSQQNENDSFVVPDEAHVSTVLNSSDGSDEAEETGEEDLSRSNGHRQRDVSRVREDADMEDSPIHAKRTVKRAAIESDEEDLNETFNRMNVSMQEENHQPPSIPVDTPDKGHTSFARDTSHYVADRSLARDDMVGDSRMDDDAIADESELPDPFSNQSGSEGMDDSPIVAKKTVKRAVIESDDEEELEASSHMYDSDESMPEDDAVRMDILSPSKKSNVESDEFKMVTDSPFKQQNPRTPIAMNSPKLNNSSRLAEENENVSPADDDMDIANGFEEPFLSAPSLPRMTPKSVSKKRRSVCVPVTPRKFHHDDQLLQEALDSPVVVEELEVVDGALKARSRPLDTSVDSNYSDFEKHVHTTPKLHSTVAESLRESPEAETSKYQPLGQSDSEASETNDDEDEEEGENLENSVADELIEDSVDDDSEAESESEEEEEEEEESSEEEEVNPEDEEKYIDLVQNSRRLYKAGNLHEALNLGIAALKLFREEKVVQYCLKLQRLIKEQNDSD